LLCTLLLVHLRRRINLRATVAIALEPRIVCGAAAPVKVCATCGALKLARLIIK